jgi:hypothetical protein
MISRMANDANDEVLPDGVKSEFYAATTQVAGDIS